SADDAAVIQWANGSLLLLTTDFFAPVLDDPYDFGRVAAANALSDIYAMGGRPLAALAVLAWPIEKLGPQTAAETLRGGVDMCEQADVSLAGGHTVENPEPLFGLCVVGTATTPQLKTNGGAQIGDLLYLTKPLGSGMLLTAIKRRLPLEEKEFENLLHTLTTLNKGGEQFGKLMFVHALTDVTGFGLLGHLSEMCQASRLSARLYWDQVPLLPGTERCITQFIYPDITFRNWKHVEPMVCFENIILKNQSLRPILTLCDPQTNGGLLVAVNPNYKDKFDQLCRELEIPLFLIGEFIEKKEYQIYIL
ncbi:MAG: selenide, water dikinase SelD, partial [Flavobacteriales bacterium]|nr:selenide, water dikinase SelD [Flavobacteriales bacterium]